MQEPSSQPQSILLALLILAARGAGPGAALAVPEDLVGEAPVPER